MYIVLEGQMANIIRLVALYRTRHELITSVLKFFLSLVTVYFDIANEPQQQTICQAVASVSPHLPLFWCLAFAPQRTDCLSLFLALNRSYVGPTIVAGY